MPKNVLVTGGAGFIASHVVDYILKTTDWSVAIVDKLTYAAEGGYRLKEIGALSNPRVEFIEADITDLNRDEERRIGKPEYIIHMAADTHVDNSITDPLPFLKSNVIGTYWMLEFARGVAQLEKFIYFSTDEVFGPAMGDTFNEWSRYNSTNPYSATKAAGEELALAWANTYGLPVVVSHCCNVFGERQHREKFIPKIVEAIRMDKEILIHSDADGNSGSRMYVYAGDVASAVIFLCENGEVRQKYNIPGTEISNETMVEHIAAIVGKAPQTKKSYPYKERPGWDFNYSIGGDNLKGLGWEAQTNTDFNLKVTVESLMQKGIKQWTT